MAMNDEQLGMQPTWIKTEFTDRMIYSREFVIDLEPDADIFRDVNLKGLLKSTF